MTEQQPIEVHNAWTIYGIEADGSEAERPLAQHGRPQDWGDPRWTYHRFRFEWLTAHDGRRYINNCHCWTDLKRQPGEYVELFAQFVAMILMPGLPAELCGREYLQEEDFWSKKWGKRPPFYEESEGIQDEEGWWTLNRADGSESE